MLRVAAHHLSFKFAMQHQSITTSIMPKVATGKANTLKQPEINPGHLKVQKQSALNICF